MSQYPAPRMWLPLTSKPGQAPSPQTTTMPSPQPRPLFFKQTVAPPLQPLESTTPPRTTAPVTTVPSSMSKSPSLQLPRLITNVPPTPQTSTPPAHPAAPITITPHRASVSPTLQLPKPISSTMPPLQQAKHGSNNPPVVDETTVFVRKTVKDLETDITGNYNPNFGKQEMINKLEKEAWSKADPNQHKSVITINGKNRGAFIEVIHYPYGFNLLADKEPKGQDNYSRTTAFRNSNVQGINNSIVSFSAFTNRI